MRSLYVFIAGVSKMSDRHRSCEFQLTPITGAQGISAGSAVLLSKDCGGTVHWIGLEQNLTTKQTRCIVGVKVVSIPYLQSALELTTVFSYG